MGFFYDSLFDICAAVLVFKAWLNFSILFAMQGKKSYWRRSYSSFKHEKLCIDLGWSDLSWFIRPRPDFFNSSTCRCRSSMCVCRFSIVSVKLKGEGLLLKTFVLSRTWEVPIPLYPSFFSEGSLAPKKTFQFNCTTQLDKR